MNWSNVYLSQETVLGEEEQYVEALEHMAAPAERQVLNHGPLQRVKDGSETLQHRPFFFLSIDGISYFVEELCGNFCRMQKSTLLFHYLP